MSDTRYLVREAQGACVGAGMFVVIDRQHGQEVSRYFYWRDQAEELASRLNTEAARGLA
jgi:hypothetical protein